MPDNFTTSLTDFFLNNSTYNDTYGASSTDQSDYCDQEENQDLFFCAIPFLTTVLLCTGCIMIPVLVMITMACTRNQPDPSDTLQQLENTSYSNYDTFENDGYPPAIERSVP